MSNQNFKNLYIQICIKILSSYVIKKLKQPKLSIKTLIEKKIFKLKDNFLRLFVIFLRSHMLQADSEEMLNCWIAALQNGIRSAIQQGQSRENPESQLILVPDDRPPSDRHNVANAGMRKIRLVLD